MGIRLVDSLFDKDIDTDGKKTGAVVDRVMGLGEVGSVNDCLSGDPDSCGVTLSLEGPSDSVRGTNT